MKKLFAIAAVTSVLALSVTACSGSSAGTGSGGRTHSTTLTLALSTGPLSMDPAKNGGGNATVYTSLAYDTLLHANPDGTFSPGLAETYGYVGAGNKEFKVTLRKGVKFSDGETLDSADVKKYVEYVKNAGGSFANIAGVFSSIETPDAQTVIFKLGRPNPDLPAFFSNILGTIVSPKALDGDAAKLGTITAGAGPYTLDPSSTVQGSQYTFVKNPNYWNPGGQYFQKVVVKVIASATSQYQALQAGQIQWMQGDPTLLSKADADGFAVSSSATGMTGLWLQDRAGSIVPALGNEKVRQAINYAIDRDALAKAVEGKLGTPLEQIMPQGMGGYDPAVDKAYSYDVGKAKQMLADAGYPHGFSFTALVAGFDTAGVKLAQGLAEGLKAIGVDMKLESKATFPDYARAQESGTTPAAILSWGSSSMYSVAQQLVLPTGVTNPFHSSDSELTSLFDEAAALPADQALPKWQQLSKVIAEKAWFAPVMAAHIVFIADKDLEGLDARGGYPNPVYFKFK